MDILFVCRKNVSRSQMAEALYRKYKKGKVLSAGTEVDKPKETLYQYSRRDPVSQHVLTVMEDENIDMSGHVRKDINDFNLNDFDKVIVLTEEIPESLINEKNISHWQIPEGKGRSLQYHYDLRDEIKRRIEKYF